MLSTRIHSRTGRLQVGLVASAAVLAVVASACAGNSVPGVGAPSLAPTPAAATVPSGTSATQTSEGGQVTVAVTWQGRQGGPVFKVALDTHSVDLDAIDLSQAALLRNDQGLEIRPTGWDAPKGGHHRSGTLSFPEVASDGAPVLDESTRTFELLIRNVAGVPERRFEWAL